MIVIKYMSTVATISNARCCLWMRTNAGEKVWPGSATNFSSFGSITLSIIGPRAQINPTKINFMINNIVKGYPIINHAMPENVKKIMPTTISFVISFETLK